MRILALTRYSLLGASSRMRFFQYIIALKEYGIEVQVSPLLRDNYLRRLYQGKSPNWSEVIIDYLKQSVSLLLACKFDLLWIEKELFPYFPAWFELLLCKRGIRYVVDYDDAIFHNYDLDRNPFKRHLIDKIDKVMRYSAMVVCGNNYLLERARVAGARKIEMIPTVVNLDRYSIAPKINRDCFVVGWIGSPSTVKYLAIIAPSLRELARECPLQLRVIGARFVFDGLDIVCSPWSEATEVEEIQKCDIGVMPLVDSLWERGKCGYKLIQYMACGLPVVASPVGVNGEIVTHGINGYLARTPDEWLNAFRALFTDAGVRRNMGIQGRLDVEKKYCLQATTPRLAQLFHETLGRPKSFKYTTSSGSQL